MVHSEGYESHNGKEYLCRSIVYTLSRYIYPADIDYSVYHLYKLNVYLLEKSDVRGFIIHQHINENTVFYIGKAVGELGAEIGLFKSYFFKFRQQKALF